MKSFLKDIALILFSTCLFLVLGELIVDCYPNEFITKYNQWYERRDSITLLLIGNSHIQMNVNANVFGSNACNMAIGGMGTNLAKKMAEEYVPQMNSLKAVVVNMDYATIVKNQAIETTKVEDDKMKSYYFIQNRYMHINRNDVHYRYAILCDQLHYLTLTNKHLTDLDLNGLDTVSLFDKDFKIWQISQNGFAGVIESLCALGKIAYDNNIRLIVVTSPAHPIFCKKTDPESIEKINHAMDSISELYPIEYKSYLSDSSFWNKELFVDVHHLNRRGATLFAKKIKEDFGL